MRKTCLVLALLAVGGCGNRMSIADQCTSYGWQPGTPGHADCQMRMRIADDNLQQRRGDAMMRMGTQMMQPPQPAYTSPSPFSSYRLPSGRIVNCSTIGTMTSCN